MTNTLPTKWQMAEYLESTRMGCNCNLDDWEPEKSTGHSWVCRIHKGAVLASPEIIEKCVEWLNKETTQ